MKGVYVLFLGVDGSLTILVGRLGEVTLGSGVYAYVGSGQIGVERRIERHLRREKRLRWHIDYITSREEVKAIAAYIYPFPRRYECRIAKELARLSTYPIRGFGSSDCRCVSHFFKINGDPGELIDEISMRIYVRPSMVFRFR